MIGCVEEAIIALELLLDRDACGLTTLESHEVDAIEYALNIIKSQCDKQNENYLKEYGIEIPVRVVRCKDCARGTLETDGAAKGYINCPYQGYGELHPQDWYCADGVRKGEEE